MHSKRGWYIYKKKNSHENAYKYAIYIKRIYIYDFLGKYRRSISVNLRTVVNQTTWYQTYAKAKKDIAHFVWVSCFISIIIVVVLVYDDVFKVNPKYLLKFFHEHLLVIKYQIYWNFTSNSHLDVIFLTFYWIL